MRGSREVRGGVRMWGQLRQVREVLLSTELTVGEVWLRYYAMGGALSRFELDACLVEALTLDDGECEVLVEAVNALLSEARSKTWVPGGGDRPPRVPADGAQRALGAAGAFLLTERQREDERVAAVRRTGLLDTVPEHRFDRISRQVRDHFGVSSATITVVDDSRCFGKSVIGPLRRSVPRSLSFADVMIRRAGPLIVEDALRDDQFDDHPLVVGGPHLRFFAGVPVRGPLGWIVGALCVADQNPRSFSIDDECALRLFARRVEDEINGPRLLSEA